MNNLQKIGGVAALINAAAYIIGFGMVFTLLAPIMDAQPEQYLAFLADNQALLYVWHLIIYIVAGVFMVPLVLAMHERLRSHAPALSQIALAMGLIWSGLVIAAGMLFLKDIVVIAELYRQDPTQAITIWPALTTVESALGGGIELPGGLWALLVSWAAWRTDALPKALNILGLLIGAAGVLMLAPAFAEAGGAIFGLGFILWFAWAGVVMMRSGQRMEQEVYMPSRPLSQHYT